jgi:hypothetical protein
MTKMSKLLRLLLTTAFAVSSIASAVAQGPVCHIDLFCPIQNFAPADYHIHCDTGVLFFEMPPTGVWKFLGFGQDRYGSTTDNVIVEGCNSFGSRLCMQFRISAYHLSCPPPSPPALPNSPKGCLKAGGTWTCSGGPGGKVSRPSCTCEF